MSRSFTVTLTFVLFALLNTAYGHTTRVFKCPCTFSVSREVVPTANEEAFDVLVEPVSTFDKSRKSQGNNIIEEHSSRNLQIRDAIHTASGYHSFEKLSITEKGLFRIRIRHHTVRREQAHPEYKLELHISAKQEVCPVVLRPDPPVLPRTSRTLNGEETLQDTTRQNRRDQRIVGGLLISRTLLPYLAAIQVPALCPDGTPGCVNLCTGTILSARWIMTAAHCAITPGSRVLVNSRSNREGSGTDVLRFIPHPDYDPNLGLFGSFFDIALVETIDDMTTCCGANPRFMPINRKRGMPRSDTFVRAAGYGVLSENMTVPDPDPGLLRQVDLPSIAFGRCIGIYAILSRRFQTCAGYNRNGGCDSCFGDSGGPLVQYATDGTPVLMGVTSFGSGCARERSPGVYTKPSGHLQWLRSTDAEFTEFTGTISEVRRRCNRGEFLPFVPGGVSQCTPCPADQVSNAGPQRLCEQCPGNLLRDTEKPNRCSCRAIPGSGLVRRKGICRRCRPGTVSPVGAPRCSKCEPGTYAPTRGLSECLPCPGASPGARVCETEPETPGPPGEAPVQ